MYQICSMSRIVREPIQVYLTPDERAELDRTAQALGISRSEALRRGILAIPIPGRTVYEGSLGDLVEDQLVTPPNAGPGSPPPSRPVATLSEIMEELAHDRADR